MKRPKPTRVEDNPPRASTIVMYAITEDELRTLGRFATSYARRRHIVETIYRESAQ